MNITITKKLHLPIWEDLINDFLEIRCKLNRDQRQDLVEKLRRRIKKVRKIRLTCGFSVEGLAVIVDSKPFPRKVWFYNPITNEIRERSVA